MIDASVKVAEPMTVAFLAVRGPYDQIPQAMGQLYAFIGAGGFVPAGMPQAVYLTAPDAGPESEALWELWAPIAGDAPDAGPDEHGLGMKHLPATLVASTMHKGPYENLEPTYRALGEWIAAEGYEMSGPPREIYYSDPGEVPPEEYLTEIQFPVSER